MLLHDLDSLCVSNEDGKKTINSINCGPSSCEPPFPLKSLEENTIDIYTKDEFDLALQTLNSTNKDETNSLIYDSIIVSFEEQNQNELDTTFAFDKLQTNVKTEDGLDDCLINSINVSLSTPGDATFNCDSLMMLEEKPINHQWIQSTALATPAQDGWNYLDKYLMRENAEETNLDFNMIENYENFCLTDKKGLNNNEVQNETVSTTDHVCNLLYKLDEDEDRPMSDLAHFCPPHPSQTLANTSCLSSSNTYHHSHVYPHAQFEYHIHHHAAPTFFSNSPSVATSFYNGNLPSSHQPVYSMPLNVSHHTHVVTNHLSVFGQPNGHLFAENQSSPLINHRHATSQMTQMTQMFGSDLMHAESVDANVTFDLHSNAIIDCNNSSTSTTSAAGSPCTFPSNDGNFSQNQDHLLDSVEQSLKNDCLSDSAQKDDHNFTLVQDSRFSETSDFAQSIQNKAAGDTLYTVDSKPSENCNSKSKISLIISGRKKLISLKEAASVKLEKVKIERANGMKIYYFKCPLCSYQTNTSQSMKDHLYCIHCKAKNNYKCNICHQTFGWKNNAQRHMRRKHKIEDQSTKRKAIITLI